MKLYNLYITAFILGLFAFSSCMDELPVKEEANGVEGLPAIVDLSYRSGAATVINTKASDITEQDAVQNLIVLVFDTNGDLVGEAQEFTPNATSGKVRLNTTSGERYIFAVANTESTNWGNLTSKIKDVKTINGDDDTALNHIIVEIKDKAVSVNDDKILMSGWFEPAIPIAGKDKGYCNINAQANGVITSITDGKIELSRIVASVRFNLKSNANITFIPESWTIKNLPKNSSLIEQDSESNDTYFIYGPSNSFENPVTDKTNSFSFLMMENRKFASGNIETYDAREKAKSAPEDFVNAPDGSAYLILKGSYSGKANYDQNGVHTNSGKDATATVTYYVHLGYLGGSNNDFSIERNNKYIYTLTVAGVDKIILEVVKNEDSASGDGDVYMPEHMLDPLDAHYGTTVLTLTKSLIESLKANTSSVADFKKNFQIRTYTPKNDFGTKTQNGELVQDYSWLSFKKNKKGYHLMPHIMTKMVES
ncbi:MAG: fimbrial protein [Parabacteroides sp.]|nr:fimbrial protein [Parabacteroides sp.]